eukprot:6846045-Pyramimonas_sp.AAC.1
MGSMIAICFFVKWSMIVGEIVGYVGPAGTLVAPSSSRSVPGCAASPASVVLLVGIAVVLVLVVVVVL